jgi:cobalt-zinc-cadmium efflux system protein
MAADSHDHHHGGHDHDSHSHRDTPATGGHDHSHHGHAHAPADFGRAFAIGTALNLGFVALELGFGVWANSLALISDATHNFADVIGLLLAWGGSVLAKRRPSARRTYGFRRASILAALGNAVLLLVAVGAIGWEALQRLAQPQPVASGVVLWVAAAGILVNGATAMLFMRGHGDLNVRGAFLHMAADAVVSLGVVIAALVIGWTGWLWIDPVVGLAVAGVILWSGWGLMRDSIDLAMDAVPRGVDRRAVETWLAGQPGVAGVHDVHIWAMSTTETALTAHLVRPRSQIDDRFLQATTAALRLRFGIVHVTLQVEAGDPAHPSPFEPEDAL